jgi:hypothetical protein
VGHAVAQWLRYSATNRKVAGSIPDGVFGIFIGIIFNGGKGGRYVGLTTLPPSCADCVKSGSLNLLEPTGPVKACNGIALPLPLPLREYVK